MKTIPFISRLATVLMCSAMALTFTACGGDDDPNPPNPDAEYEPSANMTDAQIKSQLRSSIASMKKAKQYTSTWQDSSSIEITEVDLAAKKSLELEKTLSGTVLSLHYIDDTNLYRMVNSGEKTKTKVNTMYWSQQEKYFDGINFDRYEWKVENGKFVGEYTEEAGQSYNSEEVITITLYNSDKRIKYIEREYMESMHGYTYESRSSTSMKYSASPALPSGYTAGQFPTVSQYSTWVNFNLNKVDAQHYYSYDDVSTSINIEEDNIPRDNSVNNKYPVFYTNNAFTTLASGHYWYSSEDNDWEFQYYVNDDNDGEIIYVKWYSRADAKQVTASMQ